MDDMTYEAIIVNGQIRLMGDVRLPENTKVLVVVPGETQTRPARVDSPHLAHPEQAADFELEVREVADAGV